MNVLVKVSSNGSYTGRMYWLSYQGIKIHEADSLQLVKGFADKNGHTITNLNEFENNLPS